KIPEITVKYKMNHKSRGYALIINNRDFNSETHMSSRKGTDHDAQSLYNNSRFVRVAEFCGELDLVKIVSRASHLVTFEFESNAEGIFGAKKQVPQMVSTLTKDIYF
ncbi:caspase-3-like, partial [Octopus sinensis]|uniref:Caspase-3-like n=1 Tax=Octopus sinensis TaxID=2607531 RepID=A0A7E6EGQ9_9MOLL